MSARSRRHFTAGADADSGPGDIFKREGLLMNVNVFFVLAAVLSARGQAWAQGSGS